MTLAAVWFDPPNFLYAIADSRISSDIAIVLGLFP